MINIIHKVKKYLFGDKLEEVRQYLDHYNYQRAVELIESDEHQAFEYLLKEVKECAQNGYAHFCIGRLYYNHSKYGDALKAANNAIRYLQPDKEWLGSSFYLRARINEELGNEQDMLDDLATTISLKPDDYNAHETRADWYYRQHEYDKSDADFAKLVEIQPGNPYPHAALGRTLLDKGQIEEARKKFEYCIKLDPDYPHGYSFLAECKLRQGDVIGCIEDCMACLEHDADNGKAFHQLIYGIPEDDFSILESRLKLKAQTDPGNAMWYKILGWCYHNREEYYESIKVLREAFSIDGNVGSLYNIANCYLSLGDYRRAEVYSRRALDGHEDYLNARLALARALLYQIRYQEALHEYEECRKLDPENVDVLLAMSSIYRNVLLYDEAEKFVKTAISIKHQSSDVWMTYARLLEVTGRKDELNEVLEKVVEMEGCDIRDKMMALALLGRYDAAHKVIDEDYPMTTKRENVAYCLDKAYLHALESHMVDARSYLIEALSNGMREYDFLLYHDSMCSMRTIPEFEDIVAYYKQEMYAEFLRMNKEICNDEEDEGSNSIVSVPYVSENGMCKVVGEVNGLPLSFVFDTGASDVSISTVEATFMKKNGYLEDRDFGGSVNFTTATGEVSEGTIINIRQIKVGQLVLNNVRASVVKTQNAPLLLGQSVLSRYSKVEIDKTAKVIRFTTEIRSILPEEVEAGAMYQFRTGDYRGAAFLYRQAYTVTGNIEDLQMEALCWQIFGAMKRYLAVVEEGLEKCPDNSDLLFHKAVALYYNGRVAEAIQCYRDNTKKYPDIVENWYMLAYVCLRENMLNDVIACVEEGLKVNPSCVFLYLQRAHALKRLGRIEEADKDFEVVAASEFDPNFGVIQAEALLHLGRKEECKENIKACLSEVENYAPVYQAMSKLDASEYYAELGETEEAERLFHEVMKCSTRSFFYPIRHQFDYEALRGLPDFEETIQHAEMLLSLDLSQVEEGL